MMRIFGFFWACALLVVSARPTATTVSMEIAKRFISAAQMVVGGRLFILRELSLSPIIKLQLYHIEIVIDIESCVSAI
jgi:hypothetical protein